MVNYSTVKERGSASTSRGSGVVPRPDTYMSAPAAAEQGTVLTLALSRTSGKVMWHWTTGGAWEPGRKIDNLVQCISAYKIFIN